MHRSQGRLVLQDSETWLLCKFCLHRVCSKVVMNAFLFLCGMFKSSKSQTSLFTLKFYILVVVAFMLCLQIILQVLCSCSLIATDFFPEFCGHSICYVVSARFYVSKHHLCRIFSAWYAVEYLPFWFPDYLFEIYFKMFLIRFFCVMTLFLFTLNIIYYTSHCVCVCIYLFISQNDEKSLQFNFSFGLVYFKYFG